MKSLASMVGVALLLAAPFAGAATMTNLVLAPTQPQPSSTFVNKAAKSRPAPVAHSDASLLGRKDASPVNVLVKLDYDPIAGYDGDIPGLAATNPQKTGKKLNQNKPAVDAYTRWVVAHEAIVLARIRAKIPTANVRQFFRTAYGGVAMTLPANKIDDLVTIEGVVAVQRDSVEHPTGAGLR